MKGVELWFDSFRIFNVLNILEDYPLDKLSLTGTILNPIDLSRTLILLKLDISALLGYTRAIFKNLFLLI